MELVGPALEIGKSLWTWLARHIRYAKNLEKNFKDLNEGARELYARRDDVNIEINRDRVEKMPTHACEAWLEKVGKIENHINKIRKEFEEEDRRCMSGWCPNVSLRRKLGRRVVETIDQIQKISKYEGPVVVNQLPKKIEIMPARTLKAETSTYSNLQKITNLIRDVRIGKMGVWGMGGVGKTTLMTIINNLPEITEMFNIVIWVTVSKDWSLRNIQNVIAKRLSLDMGDNETDEQVTRRLFGKLHTTKFLLLLDDLWNKVDLDKVGVPFPNQQNGSKIVLTTRFLQVCRMMETDEDIKVEVLPDDEAWILFHEKVGQVVESLEIQPWAKRAVKECGGLPLAIIVLGASLRREHDVSVWKNALRELKSPNTATFEIEGMEEAVFKPLKFSYDRLRDDDIKNCFLYGALYPEDHAIKKYELIEYWRGEGFLHDVKTLVEARDKGHAILKSLIDASLFEIVRGDDTSVKMHDVTRDLALRITSLASPLKQEGCSFLVKAGLKLEKPPKEDEWQQMKRISLMYNDLESLPEKPECPILLTLLLQRNYTLKSIPESFFIHMSTLQVLDISETFISSLPESICKLVSLRALYLCKVAMLPPQIEMLTKLETLHLENWRPLPVEILKLNRLRSLRFNIFDENDKIKNPQLSRLPLLEELILISENRKHGIKDLVEEVCKLKELTSLQFFFPSLEILQYFLHNSHSWIDRRLTSFHFHAGDDCYYEDKGYEGLYWNEYRILTFLRGGSIPLAIVEVLNRATHFSLHAHSTIQKLCDFGVQSIKGLKHCEVVGCDLMEAILEGGIDALPCLEVLQLRDLPKLKSLWKGSVPPRSLVILRVNKCPNLKRLPLGIHNAITLRTIIGEREWWDALKWEDISIKQQVQPLFHLQNL